MVAFDLLDHLGRRVTPLLAVIPTTTVVVTAAAGTRCAWYGLAGPFGCQTIAARTRDLILDTILAVTSNYSTVRVLLLDCNEQPNPQIGLKWECDPPSFQGMVLGTRCHAWVLSSPPRGFLSGGG